MTLKKWLSALLALAMLCTMVPAALADEVSPENNEVIEAVETNETTDADDPADTDSEESEEAVSGMVEDAIKEEEPQELGAADENGVPVVELTAPEGESAPVPEAEAEPEIDEPVEQKADSNATPEESASDGTWTVEGGCLTSVDFTKLKDAKNIEIPATVTETKKKEGSEETTTVTATILYIGGAFTGTDIETVSIPKNVKSIYDCAFQDCKKLKTVKFADSAWLSDIGNAAFAGCEALTTIALPERLNYIPADCFNGCKALTALPEMPGVTRIENWAFANCTGLTELKVNARLGSLVFENCTGLKSVEITGRYFQTNTFAGCTALETLKITDADVPDNAFEGFEKLKSAEITSSTVGLKAFSDCTALATLTLSKVEEIGDSAFAGCKALTTADLTDVTEFGPNAFYNCEKLKEVTLRSDNYPVSYMFDGCPLEKVTIADDCTEIVSEFLLGMSKVTEVVIPESVAVIGSYAFRGTALKDLPAMPGERIEIGVGAFMDCAELTEITIPQNVARISFGSKEDPVFPFDGCSKLKTITVNPGEESNYAAKNLNQKTGPKPEDEKQWAVVKLAEGIKRIPNEFYREDKSLKVIDATVIPESVTVIGNSAFEGCPNVTKIDIPANVKEIKDYAFADCEKVETVVIPEGVETIGDEAFRNCNMAEVAIPQSVASIEWAPFAGCESLTTLTLTIGEDAAEEDGYNLDVLLQDNYVEKVVIADGSKAIPSNFFAGRKKIDVEIPDSVTAIGAYAFSYSGVTEAPWLKNVTKIGEEAFVGCTGLTGSLDLSSLREIGGGAFAGCTGVTALTIPGDYDGPDLAELFDENSNITELTVAEDTATIRGERFAYLPTLTKVKLPKSVVTINWHAFAGNEKLETVDMSDASGLKEIDSGAFANCDSLKSIEIPDAVETMWSGVFRGTGLTEITMPAALENADESAKGIFYSYFSGCKDLAKIDLSKCEKITELEETAISNLPALTEVKLPATVTKLGEGALSNNPKLTTANLDNIVEFGKDALKGSPVTEIKVLNPEVKVGKDGIDKATTIKCVAKAANVIDYAKKNGNKLVILDPISVVTVQPLDPATYTFTGSAIEPEFTVTDGEKVLVKGTDYEVSYEPDNIHVGKITAVFTGKGDYAGDEELNILKVQDAFEIVSNVDDLKVEILNADEGTDTFYYTGEAIEPELKATIGDMILVKDTDYTVTFADNTQIGEATATVTCLVPDYQGEQAVKFQIVYDEYLLARDGKDTWDVDSTYMLTVLPGETLNLKTLKSSKPAVATVNQMNGVVTAKRAGRTRITVKVTTEKGRVKTRRLTLTVVDPKLVTKLSMGVKGTQKLEIGETITLKPVFTPDTKKVSRALSCSWSPNKDGIVDVSYDQETGKVTVKGTGKGTVKVTFKPVDAAKKSVKATVTFKVS